LAGFEEELWALVRRIPHERCSTYGALGAALDHPMSGFLVGRLMARAPEGVPWWRVVAKTGRLPIGKRNELWAIEQKRLLLVEGVAFDESGQVDLHAHYWDPLETERR
jgi:methylated-DNA-protein-cysteine methyltransferase related protein